MNKRMQSLAYQAVGMFSYNSEGEKIMSEAEFTKFAELIVRECIDVVSDCNLVDDDPIANIKEHFGVKE